MISLEWNWRKKFRLCKADKAYKANKADEADIRRLLKPCKPCGLCEPSKHFVMVTNIHGTDIELTDALKQYVEEKIVATASEHAPNAIHANIDIGMRGHHHNKGRIYYAEVNLQIPGELVRVVREADDLYKAIDEVKDELKQNLQKEKEKKRQKDKDGLREQKEYQPE